MSFTEPLTPGNYDKSRRGVASRRRTTYASYRDRLRALYARRTYTQEKIKNILNEEFHFDLTLGKLKKDLAALKLRRNREHNTSVDAQGRKPLQHDENHRNLEQVQRADVSQDIKTSKTRPSDLKTSTVDNLMVDILPESQKPLSYVAYENTLRSSPPRNIDDHMIQNLQIEVPWDELLDFMQEEDNIGNFSAGISPIMESKEMQSEWEQQERVKKSLSRANSV